MKNKTKKAIERAVGLIAMLAITTLIVMFIIIMCAAMAQVIIEVMM